MGLGATARGLVAYGVLLALAWLWCVHGRRKLVRPRPVLRVVVVGVMLQLALGLFILRTPWGRTLFAGLNHAVLALLAYTNDGTRFLVGDLVDSRFTVALNVLPTVIFFSALVGALYHMGLMQRVVGGMSWVMRRAMGLSGAETLPAAANIFIGPTEAPLLVKPYLASMSAPQLFSVMVAGFATVSGGILGAYVGLLRDVFPEIAGHLLAASVMNAPISLVVARLLLPAETPSLGESAGLADGASGRAAVQSAVAMAQVSGGEGGEALRCARSAAPETPVVEKPPAQSVEKPPGEVAAAANLVDAVATGARDGLMLALNIAAMLLAFIAFVALFDGLMLALQQGLGRLFGFVPPSFGLRHLLAWCFYPVGFLLAATPAEAFTVASLLGQKMALNELIAYRALADVMTTPAALSPPTLLAVTYALCSFANFGTIAIQIGGLGTLAPGQRMTVARLGFRGMLGGTLAALFSAALVLVLA